MSTTTPTRSASVSSDASPELEALAKKARDLAQTVAGRVATAEKLRRIPDETIADFWDTDIMRLRQPASFGGLDGTALELDELAMLIGQGDASSGWVYATLAGQSGTIAAFSPEAQHDVWGDDPRSLATSGVVPSGQATIAHGGYRLSGKFALAAGVDHAQWAVLGALTTENETHVRRLFLVPKTDYTVIDDWHSVGLVGTGSKTIVVDELVVPTHRSIIAAPFLSDIEPFSLQAPIIGAASGALRAFTSQSAKARPHPMSGVQAAKPDSFHTAVGASYGEVQAAWTILTAAVRRTLDPAPASQPERKRELARNRAASATISSLLLRCIERIFELTGGGGIYQGPVSRALLDIRAGTTLIASNPFAAAQMAGSLLYELE